MWPTLPDASLFTRWRTARVKAVWLAYWVALFLVMHTPREHLPEVHVSNLDKVTHFTGYALLTLLGGAYAQRAGKTTTTRWCAFWFVLYAAYAAVDELTQPFVNRSAGVADWAADVLGVGVALLIVRLGRPAEHAAR